MTDTASGAAGNQSIEPVTLAFVGVGRYGTHLGQDVQGSEFVRVGACYDIRRDAMDRFVARNGGVAAGSLEEILDRPDIDGVVVATPNNDHRRTALMVLSANKHVFIEKPIATSTSEASELIHLASQARLILMTGHNSRRAHAVRQMHTLIHSGELGIPISVEGNFAAPTHLRVEPSHWSYRRDSMPGGALLEGGIHLIDICNYLLSRPIAVTAILRRRATPGESEDACAMLCRYQAPGETGEGYFSDIPVSILSSTVAPSTNLVRVSGTKANALISDRNAELVLEQPDGQRVPCQVATPFDGLRSLSTRRQELDEFAYCIRTGMTPETDGICGLKALAVVEAAILANGKGAEVFIDELGLAF